MNPAEGGVRSTAGGPQRSITAEMEPSEPPFLGFISALFKAAACDTVTYYSRDYF